MFTIGKSDGIYPGRKQSDTIAFVVLAANTEQHFTAPAGSSVAVFAATGNFFCDLHGTAAIPGATDTSYGVTIPELNPTVLTVTGGTTVVSLISSGTPTITISFYKDVTQTLANG